MRRWLVGLIVAVGLLSACTGGSSQPPQPTPTSQSSSQSSAVATPPSAPAPASSTWYGYHGDPQRSGYSATMPQASGKLTATTVALDGQVYASPIIVGDLVIVATEQNTLYGLTKTGAIKWQVTLGTPTARADLPCGNIDPLGITGTPVFDPASNSVFAVASIGATVRHDLVSLNPETGAVRWRRSVDLPGTAAQAMQERGALTILGGRVWVPFGGLAGDCGAYKGRLVGVPVGNGEPVSYTVPTGREAGIWTPPGPTVFGGNLLVAVGNGESVGEVYDYSDSVLKVSPAARLLDSYSPDTWAADNAADLDLGSQGPAVVQGKWVFAAGKSGTVYVLRAAKLGGIGGEVSQANVCKSFGGTAVVDSTVFVPCSDGVRAVVIGADGKLAVGWHAAESIAGSPVVGGGRVYALDQSAGVLDALDLNTGTVREQVSIGAVSRFATPAISGGTLFLPTLTGVAIVATS